jgi:membrane protein DedA with SNARE-associated domain
MVRVITSSLWVMFCLFLFNTLGNILSENHLEKIIFTPVTIVLSLLMLVLILKKN